MFDEHVSNLLDNTIEGCQRLSGSRSIRCCIELTESLYISIRNTAPPVSTRDGLFPATKTPQEHGFGITSVRRILDGYRAEYAFQYLDGWFLFAAELPLTSLQGAFPCTAKIDQGGNL